MATGNVVTTAFGRPSQVLGQCRKQLGNFLDAHMEPLWQQVDDSLFRRAEQAGSSGEQTEFFDAMRQVRLQREGLEARFRALLAERFGDFLNGQYRYRAGGSEPAAEGELSLVDNDELEIELAVQGMSRRARAENESVLAAIRKRLEALTSRKELPQEVIPLDPGVIAEAFAEALGELDQGVAVQLIILKLFDQGVIGTLDEVYARIDEQLRAEGLLPDLDPSAVAGAPAGGKGERRRASDGDDEDELPEGADLFNLLRQAVSKGVAEGAMSVSGTWNMPPLGEDGQPLPVAPGAPGGVGGSGPWPMPPGTVVAATPDLVQALSSLQHEGVGGDAGAPLQGEALGAHIVQAVSRIKGAEVAGIDPVDQTLVDIVSTLFDFIYDDPSIPDRIKVLIGRLQIPVIKVAILDKGFFARKNNPARRLLNTLARAGLGWVDDGSETQQALYRRMEQVVERILDEFEDDVEVFEQELEAFEHWLQEEQQRALQQEEQSARADQNREQLAIAKAVARQAISQVLDDVEVPEPVRAFLEGTWKDLLVVLHLRAGSESETWKKVLKVAVTLVWSLQPKADAAERKQLAGILPALIRSLREGMRRMSVSEEAERALLELLSREHARLMQQPAAGEQPVPVTERPGSDTNAATTTAAEAQSADSPGGVSEGAMEPASEDRDRNFMARKIDEINRLLESGQFSIEEEIVMGEDARDEAPVEDEFVQQARDMEDGTWLEIEEDDQTHRIKLSWRSLITGKIFFVNRQGLKVREMTVYGLAALLRSGRARVLDNAPVLDRAIGTLLSTMRGGAAAAGGE